MPEIFETYKVFETYEMDPFRPLRKIGKAELDNIIAQHEKWVASHGKEGERADLSYVDLSDANLEGSNLQQAIFAGAKLNRANLRRTNLKWAVFFYANLNEADVSEADCYMAILIKAKLKYLMHNNTKFEHDGIKSFEQIELESYLKSNCILYDDPRHLIGSTPLYKNSKPNDHDGDSKERNGDHGWAFRTRF